MRLLTAVIVAALCSCKGKPTTSRETNKAESKDTTRFFQVSQYIQGQINEVNKTPYFIYRVSISGNNKDSSAIDNDAFNELSKQFLQPDINDPSIKKYYTESIFFDETTKTFTISYATLNKDLPIQNVEILLKEDGKTVKRIFIRKFYNYTDSSAIEQLSWKPNESFQVMRLLQMADQSETSRQTTVVWNDKG